MPDTHTPTEATSAPAAPDLEVVTAEEEAKPARPRWKWAVHGLNLLLLVVLVLLFLAWAVQHRQQPVYGWVAGTGIETFCRQIGPFFRRGGARIARDKPLLPEERRQAAPLLARLAELQPQHVVLMEDGRRYFGQLREDPANGRLTMHWFDGERFQKTPLEPAKVALRRPVVVPVADFRPADIRFLLRYPEADPYLLPPYLFMADCPYDKVYAMHFALCRLEEEFCREFAPLVEDADAGQYIHVRLFPDRMAFLEAVRDGGEYALVNSVGFFRKTANALYLCESPQQFSHNVGRSAVSGLGGVDPGHVVRHEGAHQLSVSLGIFSLANEPPVWLEEGLAQYCETAPFGAPLPANVRLLQERRAAGALVPWPQLLAARAADLSATEADQQLVYAQAWLLFCHCMAPANRQRFFRYLSELRGAPVGSANYDPVNHVLNNLETTPERLADELAARLIAGPAAFPE